MDKRSQQGFTLVELMVVVAIIGILSAVAIPNFKKYQAKSKTSEAKVQLAAVYMAQTSFYADRDTYAVCLGYMGYDPSAEQTNRYYSVGFNGTANPTAGSIPATCTTATRFYAGGKRTGSVAVPTEGQLPATSAEGDSFTAGAAGSVSGDNTKGSGGRDRWTIDENKFTVHVDMGY